MANKDFSGLIDRDFLGSEEILRIRRMQPNLFVLRYYCMENYPAIPTSSREFVE